MLGYCLLAAPLAAVAIAQPLDRPASLPPADVEQLDASSAAHLENARRFIAEQQWGEAVEAIRRVQESEPTRLVRVPLGSPVSGFTTGFERYVTAAEYCQWRLASLADEAPEALEHYRRLVDGLAENWFRAGEKNNDERLLSRVVEQAFASRFGDGALLKLGDLALARGDTVTARARWQRISPTLEFTAEPPGESASSRAARGGVYPDTDLDLAAVLARLVLASIMEDATDRAARELAVLRQRYPAARGELGGRTGLFADLLQSLLEESSHWPPRRQSPDWTTLGGDQARGKAAAGKFELAEQPLWSVPLPRLTAGQDVIGEGRLRPADDSRGLLSYDPIVVGEKVYLRLDVRGNSRVVALDLHSGQTAWQVEYSRGGAPPPLAATAPGDSTAEASDAHEGLGRQVGVARHTLTAAGPRLFARMGSPITVPSSRRSARWLAKEQGFLLGLDTTTEGRPLEGFPILPPTNEWTFEGPPLEDGGTIYVAMRRVEGARSQVYLAAFERPTTPAGPSDDRDESARPTGRLKWRTRIASAVTFSGGDLDQLTHLLVTQAGGRLYLNTNAGAVAAVRAEDGHLLWLVKYPRTGVRTDHPDQPEQHLFRDRTPCLAAGDLVLVAPADCDRIFALSAVTGELAWSLPPGTADDAVHLLGVERGTLLASGNYLYWIDVASGRLLTQFPPGKLGGAEQSAPSPRGFGRGVIASGEVWWPTRETILVFQAQAALSDFGMQPRLVREISLRERGVTGGNLVLAGGVVLIAGSDKLVAFGPRADRGRED